MSDSLREIEIDALGEILNISMGSAATAVSTMLDTKVEITTPQVDVRLLKDINSSMFEPAMIVKIVYVAGIEGSNVMVFRQQDMKEILARLMGMEVDDSAEFNFDEIAMSAACEVMNQMMGSSATALSEFLGRTIDISPPQAYLMDETHNFKDAVGLPLESEVVTTNFNLVIGDNINSEYMSVMSVDLAKILVSPFVGGGLLDENPIENGTTKESKSAPPPI
ncbi:MAG: chemotaxis protein CheC, partial [Oscillospiraceae bacterium]